MLDNLRTRQYFNAQSSEWNARAIGDPDQISRLLSRLEWHHCHRILDLGCGTGVLFPFLTNLAHQNATILALDFAEEMIQAAAKHPMDRIQLLCGCARYLPLLPNTIDRILAFHVWPHILGQEKALQECWRILKPQGDLVIMHLCGSREINAIHQTIGGPVRNHTLASASHIAAMLLCANFQIADAIDRSDEYFVRGIKRPLSENAYPHCLVRRLTNISIPIEIQAATGTAGT